MMLSTILAYYDQGMAALNADAPFSKISSLPVREAIGRFKYVPEKECEARYQQIMTELAAELNALTEGGMQDA